MKITFLLITEYLKHQQVYTMLKMIDAAMQKGHEIAGVFLFGSGVMSLPKKRELGKGTRDIPSALSQLASDGIPLYACQTWADYYGIFPENAIEGLEIVGLGDFSNLVYESDKLIAFGART